jgi:hypothetical protein
MKKTLILAAVATTMTAAPAFAGTSLTTVSGTAGYNAPAGATAVNTFDNPTSAVQGAAALGWTLTRAGVSFRTTGTSYGNTATIDGSANTTKFDYIAPDGYDNNGYYVVGGTTSSGVASFAQFLGTQALSSISVYIGTIDSYNQVQLLGQAGNVIDTFSGTTINGAQTTFPGSTSLRATFTGTGGTEYYGIRFSNSTGQGSFEFDNLAFTASVPEPATWAMMLLGFGMVGAVARRRGKAALAAA